MASAEFNPALANLIGNADPHRIIESLLIPARYKGESTQKYFVQGLPEVIVRHTPGEPEPEMRDTVAAAFGQLSTYGIVALPYIPVEHKSEVYVFTLKAHGTNLEELVSHGTEPAVIQQIDTQWANMITHHHAAKAEKLALIPLM